MPNLFKEYSNGYGHMLVSLLMQVCAVVMMLSSNQAVVTAGITLMTLVATAWLTPSVATMAARKAVDIHKDTTTQI